MNNVEVHPELAGGLTGGKKQLWLRLHRREVENYYAAYGPEHCKARFNLTGDTLQRFFERQHHDVMVNKKLSESDRWVKMVCEAGIAENRGRINRLEDRLDKIEPIANIGRSLIAATSEYLESKVGSKPLLEVANGLDDLGAKSE